MTETDTTLTPLDTSSRLGCSLRDFFIASNGDDLLTAFHRLNELAPELPRPISADSLEFSFNRLFIGPQAPIAPPFASVYQDEDDLVMGRATQDARDLYHSLGLVSPWQGTFPDDHIALEIDACLQMKARIAETGSNEITTLYQNFLQEHLLQWVPQFAARVYSAEGEAPQILGVVRLTVDWLQNELT